MKKKIILPVFAILSIALILVGTSYAYWRFTYISDKTNIGKSKCLSIELTNQKNEISLNNTYPISDLEAKKLTPYSFTINNACDTFISYDVNLEMLEGTTMNSKYMAVMINNEHKELLSNLDNANTVMSSSVESRKLVSGSLGVGDSVDYTLRLWMNESVTLSDDAMNKNFTSKIVVTAQPSNYSPKDAGYDTLHDAILANEYQTTPEKAIEKIKAKGKPDLSQTAPRIKWIEKTGSTKELSSIKIALSSINIDEATNELTEKDTKLKLYTSYSFNAETGIYTLAKPIYADPTEITFNQDIKYYFCSESSYFNVAKSKIDTTNSTTAAEIYMITEATKVVGTSTWGNKLYDSNTYNLTAIALNGNQSEIDKSDTGLYQDVDDYGTTYYYRGNVKNNNVYFAGFYWQIVRINGDKSIRLMYNGDVLNAQDKTIGNYRFNSKNSDIAYIGYMYGDLNGLTFNEKHSNTNDSEAKLNIDKWYQTNIIGKGYEKYVSEKGSFCGDRSLIEGDGISKDKNSYFLPYGRYTAKTAQFACPDLENDLYTTTDSNIGNKSLKYPVALITYDELAFAGFANSSINEFNYAYSSTSYYTMSPSSFNSAGGYARIMIQENNGSLSFGKRTSSLIGLRPVINLKSDVKITGGIGTSNDPFVIDTSK